MTPDSLHQVVRMQPAQQQRRKPGCFIWCVGKVAIFITWMLLLYVAAVILVSGYFVLLDIDQFIITVMGAQLTTETRAFVGLLLLATATTAVSIASWYVRTYEEE